MSKNNVKEGIISLRRKSLEERRNLIKLYADKPQKIGEDFFGELLKEEFDSFCKWYEIKALGDLKSNTYSNLFIEVLKSTDVSFGETSLYSISAYSIGKIGEASIDYLRNESQDADKSKLIIILDSLSMIECFKSFEVIFDIVSNQSYIGELYYTSLKTKNAKLFLKKLEENFNNINSLNYDKYLKFLKLLKQ